MTAVVEEQQEWMLGSTTPRIFTPPLPEHADDDAEYGIKPEATWGPQCCDFLENVLGWKLIEWQRWLYYRALEKRANGTGFRFKFLLVLIGRQQGKTKWGMGLALWRLFMDPNGTPDPNWPAAKNTLLACQNLDYAEGTLKNAVDEVKDSQWLRPEFIRHMTTSGKHTMMLTGRRQWRVATGSRKGGRSLSIDHAWLDELREQQNWEAWRAITPTTTSRPNSLVVCTSNAGDVKSVVLRSLRDAAIRKITTNDTDGTETGIFEWSVPDEVDPRDERFWYMAAPSMGRLNEFSINDLRAAFESMEHDDMPGFMTEYLALDVATPILTVDGWKTMGTIESGDQVFHPDGHPVEVVAATPVFNHRACFEVTTTDGRSVVCDADHLWTVYDRRRNGGRNPETLSTKDLLARGVARNQSGGKFAFRLPRQHAIISKPADLPIDPYLLGLWLGDGSATKPEISCGQEDLDELTKQLPAVITGVRPNGPNAWYVSFRISHSHARDGSAFPTVCRDLGIWEKDDKHIPELYLTAGTEQRLALLQGLCDTDGSIDANSGLVRFASSRRRLADQVLYLARSLGFRATIRVQKPAKDRWINGCLVRANSESYQVGWTQDAADPAPFRFTRKLARIRTRPSRAGERTAVSIRSITPAVARAVRCIQVGREDGLYLAGRDLTPTHNCMWVSSLKPGIIPAYAWADTSDPTSRRAEDAKPYVCVDVNYHRTRGYVAVGAKRDDGLWHTQVIHEEKGTDWILKWLKDNKHKFTAATAQVSGAPVSGMVADIKKALGRQFVEWGTPMSQLVEGAQAFYDGITHGTIKHPKQPVLDRSAESTVARTVGSDAWFFCRRTSPVDAAPLIACCGAVWLAKNPPKITDSMIHSWPDEDVIEQWRREADERYEEMKT